MPFGTLLSYWDVVLHAIGTTVLVAAVSIVGGLVLAIACAALRMGGIAPLRATVAVYVELIRNTPLLVQLFLLFFGLPVLGVTLSPVVALTVGLAVNNGAYMTEIIRGGLQSVPRGQREAAAALGLSSGAAFLHVILPQGAIAILPALTNQFAHAILATSMGSIIGAPELTAAVLWVDSVTYRTLELLAILSGIYLLMTAIVGRLANVLSARMRRAYQT